MAYIGPNTMSLNYTHMSDIKVSGKPPKVYTNTLLDFINNRNDTILFSLIVKRANYEKFLSNIQTNVTLFIPQDKYIYNLRQFIDNMDILTARKIVQSSMINRKICCSLLKASPHIYLTTSLPANKLEVINLNGQTSLNGSIQVLDGGVEVDNGVIHFVTRLIYPVTNSTAHYSAQTY